MADTKTTTSPELEIGTDTLVARSEQLILLFDRLKEHGYDLDEAEKAHLRRELNRGTYGEIRR